MDNKKHIWHRIEPSALLITVIIIPLMYWWVTSRSEGDKIRLEYVRLAIGILQPTEKDKQPEKEIRSWAVQILQDSSPVKLSPDAVRALMNGDSNLPRIPVVYTGGGEMAFYYETNNNLISTERVPSVKK